MKQEDFYELLKKRKSIRKYKSDPVPQEKLERILSAGMEAPSGKNRQNWKFFVVQGKKRDEYLSYSQKTWSKLKDVLSQRLKPSLYEFTERFFYTLGGAPVVIFVYSDNTPEEKYLTSVGSVYMAVENMNLACFVEGLGCCTMGAPLEIKEDIHQFLGIQGLTVIQNGTMDLLCALVIGYPDHEPPKAPRIIENKVTWLS